MSESLTANVFTLRQDDSRRGPSGDPEREWQFVAGPIDVPVRMRPDTALSNWANEHEPEPGHYRIELSDGRTAEVHYPGPPVGAGARRDAA